MDLAREMERVLCLGNLFRGHRGDAPGRECLGAAVTPETQAAFHLFEKLAAASYTVFLQLRIDDGLNHIFAWNHSCGSLKRFSCFSERISMRDHFFQRIPS